MKILVLCERVDAEGGTETYLRALLPALSAHGDEVRAIAREAAQPGAYGVPSEAIAWSDEHETPSLAAAARVDAIAAAFAPDVVAVHNVLDASVIEAVRVRARRAVYHLHDHRPFCPNGDRLYPQGGGICGVPMSPLACGWHALVHGCAYGPRSRTLELIGIRQGVAQTIRSFDATIALSRYVADLAIRNGVAADRAHVIAPPLDDAAFAPAPAQRPATDAVLFAGRVMPSKGARSLVRALAHLARAERPVLRIAGDGPDLAATLDEASARGVAVQVLGRLDAAAMRRAYDDATLVAVPSLWGEPFGLVGIEAFARGRPAVAYDAGGISEWMADGGRLVPRGDERALATAVRALLEPPSWREACAKAFAAARAYRLGDHVERIRSLYGAAP